MLELRGATVPLTRETLQCSPNEVCQHVTRWTQQGIVHDAGMRAARGSIRLVDAGDLAHANRSLGNGYQTQP